MTIAIDDFGTGHSSLTYLRRFPVDVLKIDRSFVRSVDVPNSDDRPITSLIISLGHTLKLQIVAEGVERESQLRWLAQEGCHAFQGYLVSAPLPAQAFEQFLRERLRLSA